jgi:putative addiction module killer protein
MNERSRRASATFEVFQTHEFGSWLRSLPLPARARILLRIDRVMTGNLGDWKSLGGGVGELRVDCGPGYRLYFARKGQRLILLAYGGDKSRQKTDIARAREIAAAWEPENGD